MSLSSWRAWIEIYKVDVDGVFSTSRSPHGERGLKSFLGYYRVPAQMSLSSWRAWIEMLCRVCFARSHTSLSSWRAWIEMVGGGVVFSSLSVALLMESVD